MQRIKRNYDCGAGNIMYQLLVKSRSDAGAIESMIEHFYNEWPIIINTLKGGRTSQLEHVLEDLLKNTCYNFILLGRKDRDTHQSVENVDGFNNVVYLINRSRVRNTRIEHLAWIFEKARSLQRLRISCLDEEIVLGRSAKLLIPDPEPYMDLFILYVSKSVSKKIGLSEGAYLVLRMLGGKHLILDATGVKGTLLIPDIPRTPKYSGENPSPINPHELVRNNIGFLEKEENIVVSFLEKFSNDYERVIVPISGGKDSATALYLAKKVYKDKVEGVFVDIDVDMPLNREFIELLGEKLGVYIHRVKISLREHLIEKGFPTTNNRWCTALKISALEKKYADLCRGSGCLIVVGDRDVESETRSRRSPVIVTEKYTRIAPLKQWSTLTLQLYMLYRNIPLNPLYEEGFYRLGCYICPSLRGWEHLIIHNSPMLRSIKNDQVYAEYRKYLENRA